MGIRSTYLTVQEPAELLGVVPNTVRKRGNSPDSRDVDKLMATGGN